MRPLRWIVIGLLWNSSTLYATASARTFPMKPIRILTSEAGGGNDFISRLVAQAIAGPLGQNIIVDNRAAAVGGELVARAPPDGYTLLIAGSTFVLGPLLQKMPYDSVRDFEPITILTKSPSVLVVNSAVSVSSVKELIALARSKPGLLNYASTGTGGSNHLGAELFKSMADVNIVRVNYKGSGAAINALLSGEVQMMFVTAASAALHVKAGRLKSLAVTGLEPSALAPGLPTVAASGLPGYEFLSIIGMFAPAKTPDVIIQRLNQEVVRAVRTSEINRKLLNAGAEVVGSSSQEMAQNTKSVIATVSKLIKQSGITPE